MGAGPGVAGGRVRDSGSRGGWVTSPRCSLAAAHVQEPLPPARADRLTLSRTRGIRAAEPEPPGRGPRAGHLPCPGPRPAAVSSRYAGAMLLHAFLARDAGRVLAAAAGPGVALLTAVSMCFALGASTRAVQAPAAAEAGPLSARRCPGCGRCARLAAIAPTDPLKLQQLFASAMLSADPVTSVVYYVDDHFVPYTGA